MMRSPTHKMVYYIGQAAGELYDLEADPGELWNRWEDAGYAVVRDQMKEQLLSWLATSNYYNAGYKRNRSRQYRMRWPTETDPALHGRSAQPKQVDWL
jgi:hypothetical protein